MGSDFQPAFEILEPRQMMSAAPAVLLGDFVPDHITKVSLARLTKTVKGKVAHVGQEKVYSFVAPATGSVVTSVTTPKRGKLATAISIYDSSGILLTADQGGGSGLAAAGTAVTAGQTYYVRVSGDDNTRGSYRAKFVAATDPAANISLVDYAYSSYGQSDSSATTSISSGVLSMMGNSWKKAALAYNITPYTVLEFDYKSSGKGDIQGIGFDDDDTPSWNRFFELRGNTPWGIDNYTDYDSSQGQWKHYKIKVGDLFTGDIKYLTFVNYVAGGKADSQFKNVKLYDTAGTTQAPKESIPLYALAQNGNIRAVNIWQRQLDLLPSMVAANVNTLIVKEGAWVDPQWLWVSQDIVNTRQWIDAGHKAGMNVIIAINFWNQEDTDFSYQPWVDETGAIQSGNACPNDEALWSSYMYTRIRNVLQANPDPDGLLLDLEMYQTEPNVDYTGGCYCPQCLTRFANGRNIAITGTMDQFRQQVVANSALKNALLDFETQEIASRASYIRQNLVPANIALAAFHLDVSNVDRQKVPFSDGMAIGLGTAERPVLHFSESLYGGKARFGVQWHDYIVQSDKYLQSIGAHVQQVFGVGMSYVKPQDMKGKLFSYAHSSAGSWIFTIADFDPARQTALLGTPDQYLASMTDAFGQLESFQTSGTYYDPLQLPLTM